MTSWLERRHHDQAVNAWRKADAVWAAEQTQLETLKETAATFTGLTKADDPRITVELHRDERTFYICVGAALIEPRRLPSHWQGGYSGFSFRIAKGVRWHVGGTRGHTIPGDEVPTPIDTGTVTITNQRVVFQGSAQAREWAYTKLIGYQHDPTLPRTTFPVSNRQKVSGVLYDREHAEEFHFRLALALAHHHEDVDGFVDQLNAQLDEHIAHRPLPPPPISS